jgi:hypothetical protein
VLWVPLRNHNLLQPTGTTVSIEADLLAVLNMFGSTSENGDIDMESEVDAQATEYVFALKRVQSHDAEALDPAALKK